MDRTKGFVHELSNRKLPVIALYEGTSILSLIIRFRCWSRYSHAAWLCSDGSVIEAWQRGGVRHVASVSSQHTPGTVVRIYDVPGVDRVAVESFLTSQIGKPYDFFAILGFVFRRPFPHLRPKWFCSELVSTACDKGGVRLLNKPAWKTSPGDIADSVVPMFAGEMVTE